MGKRNTHSRRFWRGVLALALAFCLLPVPEAEAAGTGEGLVVERLYFRDILGLYARDRDSFGVDAAVTDSQGITNAARRLAELFTYTVGLNYTGEGLNSDYFSRDITGEMGQEPYTEENRLSSYEVEIAPCRGFANPLPQGSATVIYVYLAGYTEAASGVQPVLQYVWQEGERWYAVRDDFPYYKISYNGRSIREMQQDGYSLLRARATSGTELLGAWEALPATDAAAGQVVHGPGYSIVVGDAGANLFAVSRLGDPLPAGGISSDFLAVSDFVKGSMTYQTGPLVYSRSCATADGSYVTPGASLTPGESYRIHVVYDEALNAVGPVEVQAVCAGSGSVCAVTDLVWYGSQEYLLADNFNPHVLEFTVTPAGDTADWCVFTIQGLTGSSSALKAAPFRLQLTNSPEEELRQNLLERFLSAAGKEDAATPVTRGMVAEVLWRLCGTPILESETMYTDVQPGTNRAMALTWAEANGLIQGYGDGRVGTEDVLSREQAAVILLRYAQILGSDISIQGDLTAWSDGDAVSYWARDGVLWAVNAGILDTSGGQLLPGQTATCGECAQMLAQTLGGCLPSM